MADTPGGENNDPVATPMQRENRPPSKGHFMRTQSRFVRRLAASGAATAALTSLAHGIALADSLPVTALIANASPLPACGNAGADRYCYAETKNHLTRFEVKVTPKLSVNRAEITPSIEVACKANDNKSDGFPVKNYKYFPCGGVFNYSIKNGKGKVLASGAIPNPVNYTKSQFTLTGAAFTPSIADGTGPWTFTYYSDTGVLFQHTRNGSASVIITRRDEKVSF
ncbi:hypothetical protein ACFOY2_54230 [Nonomuraea purpurea]|uniref:Tat pathway signal sequence domain protein n=1 Tax=Nonomuraea purpurea TaxID=1849276 RepID=A0ABV8GT92_9ACTN